VRYSLLQCAAVCCSMLQYDALCCSSLRCFITTWQELKTETHCNILLHCSILQNTATHHNILQHAATHCNTLQLTATRWNKLWQAVIKSLALCVPPLLAPGGWLIVRANSRSHQQVQCVAVCCVAVCCSVLQCVAVCCSVLQCAAV